VLTRFAIAEGSMRPALCPGEYVVAVRTKRPPRRGEIIVYEHPTGFHVVKRIIGLPGETIEVADGSVWLGGTRLHEPWTSGSTEGALALDLGPGEAYVLGDVRTGSTSDSRQIGPIRIHPAWWRVVGRYWPLGRFGSVS